MEEKLNLDDRIYWLKFFADIFDRKEIIMIRELPSGSDHLILYLRMMAASVSHGGYIKYEGIKKTPEEEVAMALHEDENKIRYAVEVLRRLNLLIYCENGDFFFPYVVDKIGSESGAAKRMRLFREKHKKGNLLGSQQTVLSIPAAEKESGIIGTIPDMPPEQSANNVKHCSTMCAQSANNVQKCYAKSGIIGIIPELPPAEQNRNNVQKCYKSGIMRTIPNMPVNSEENENAVKAAPIVDSKEQYAKKELAFNDDAAAQSHGIIPVDATGITGIIPNMPVNEDGTGITGIIPNMPVNDAVDNVDSVDNSSPPVLTVKLVPEEVERNHLSEETNCYNVNVVTNRSYSLERNDNNNEILNLKKSIHPTTTKSSLKSEVGSNNNKERALRAHSVEETEDLNDSTFSNATTRQKIPVDDGEKTLDGWMDLKNNSMTNTEIDALFQKFMENYPRPAGKATANKKAFREMVYLHHVDPYDLVEAAEKYAKSMLEEKKPERFMKMPQNFLQEFVWLRYVPVFQRHCPKCHGTGTYEEKNEIGQTEAFYCKCRDRYKRFTSSV